MLSTPGGAAGRLVAVVGAVAVAAMEGWLACELEEPQASHSFLKRPSHWNYFGWALNACELH
jgi:hypothetical protein